MGAMPRTIRVLSPLAAGALGCLLLPAAFAAQPGSPGKGEQSYSWVDKNGERHYGDAVPPEYAQTEQRVLNERGVEVDRVGAGDAGNAGILHGSLDGDLETGLRYGAAMASLKHTIPGDELIATREEIEAIMNGAGTSIRR